MQRLFAKIFIKYFGGRQMSTKERGVVRFFNEQKGYGFITPKDGGKDLFVHATQVRGADQGHTGLVEGSEVEYIKKEGKKGLEATEVTQVS